MFRIGEFAQIGRVSARQLRHYDRLELLEPEHTDHITGYRYYSTRQLPRLNRLLALKAFGFSLEQIGPMLDDAVSADELRGMLLLRKADVERDLAEQQLALRQIEAHIRQIEEHGALSGYDVAVRAEPERPYLSLRQKFSGMNDAKQFVGMVAQQCARQLSAGLRDRLTIVAHTDFEDESLDLEIGVTLSRPVNTVLRLPGDLVMNPGELEPVDSMACIVRSGPPEQSHSAYGALGVWMEANGYSIDGPCREVFLELPSPDPPGQDPVIEIQFPVRKFA